METDEDMDLLRQWAETRSDEAFRVLAGKYTPLVWGVVLRKTNDRSLAEEAVQQVFADLSRKAPELIARPRLLAPWLHRTAVYESVQVLRREIRHRERMKQYALSSPAAPAAPDPWEEVRPHLDDAINSLGETDRRVLLLHWYERRTFAQVANQLGGTPAAAQRRGLRALEKLSRVLGKRGAVMPVSLLTAGLSLQLAPPVPAVVLAASASTAAAAATSVAATGVALTFQSCLQAMASAKLATAAVFLAAAFLPVSLRWTAAAVGSGTGNHALISSPASAGAPSAVVSGSGRTKESPDLQQLREAMQRLAANPADYATELLLRRLMFSLKPSELAAVQDLLLAVPVPDKKALCEVAYAFFARWAEIDPAAAMKGAASVPMKDFGYYPRRGAFVTWASVDLEAAWSWLEKNAADAMDRQFLGGEALAAVTASQGNGAAMMARADAISDPEWRQQMRYWVMRAWTKHGSPGSILAWALALPESPEREDRIARTIEQIGLVRPDAVSFIAHIENPARRAEVGHNILWPYLLARHPRNRISPPDFVDDLKNLTGQYPVELFRDAGEAIARHGAVHAMNKLAELPESEARDEFIQGMLRSADYSDAKTMLPAVGLLHGDALIRNGGLSHFTEVLTKQDPRAAAEWIVSLPEGSPVRQWAGSHFEAISGKSATAFLFSSAR